MEWRLGSASRFVIPSILDRVFLTNQFLTWSTAVLRTLADCQFRVLCVIIKCIEHSFRPSAMFFKRLKFPGSDDQQVTALIVCVFLVVAGFCFWQSSVTNSGFIDFEDLPSRPVEYVVDVNAARWPELANLPGIGEKLARQIVQHREQTGPFKSAEELMDIHGIGEVKLAGIQSQIVITESLKQTAERPDQLNAKELR